MGEAADYKSSEDKRAALASSVRSAIVGFTEYAASPGQRQTRHEITPDRWHDRLLRRSLEARLMKDDPTQVASAEKLRSQLAQLAGCVIFYTPPYKSQAIDPGITLLVNRTSVELTTHEKWDISIAAQTVPMNTREQSGDNHLPELSVPVDHFASTFQILSTNYSPAPNLDDIDI